MMNYRFMRYTLALTLLCSFASQAVERVYYVAAQEMEWDYAPTHHNLMMNMPLTADQQLFVKTTDTTIGSKYKKAMYVEYTDGTFSQIKKRPAKQQHLGLLGPLFRAEVGDSIKVVFRNNGSRAYSIHPHGVYYDKRNEGAPTNDDTSGRDKLDDKVAPGTTFTYHWQVPETAGPG
ncbi:MAG: multicopper oxidase domain-containing protein, partial [Psychrobium sp.]|nr:multicopper oxidase domain-containing protein [Psychrobium sp.]